MLINSRAFVHCISWGWFSEKMFSVLQARWTLYSNRLPAVLKCSPCTTVRDNLIVHYFQFSKRQVISNLFKTLAKFHRKSATIARIRDDLWFVEKIVTKVDRRWSSFWQLRPKFSGWNACTDLNPFHSLRSLLIHNSTKWNVKSIIH